MAYPYATVASVRNRLWRPGDTQDTVDDGQLAVVVQQTNTFIETFTGRAIGSDGATSYTYDGCDALEGGRLLLIPQGIRTATTLEIADYTGASFTTVTSGDYFLRPVAQERVPGWPAFELWMTDIPSASTTTPVFLPGFANVRVTGTFGWAAMPDDVREVAELTAVRAWRSRAAGQVDTVGPDEFGQPTISRFVSARDMGTLRRYRWQPVTIA